MKMVFYFMSFLLIACSPRQYERSDWDSGAKARQDHQFLRQQQQSETMRNQLPRPGAPGPHQGQPF
jgi:hypothetical protein